MAYVAIDEFGDECILDPKPSKNKKDKDWKGYWNDFYIGKIRLPKGTIKKLIKILMGHIPLLFHFRQMKMHSMILYII